jgi:hypothetical protein
MTRLLALTFAPSICSCTSLLACSWDAAAAATLLRPACMRRLVSWTPATAALTPAAAARAGLAPAHNTQSNSTIHHMFELGRQKQRVGDDSRPFKQQQKVNVPS